MTATDVLTRMLHSIDALDWETLRDSFAPEVRTDYTSLWGGEPAIVKVDDLLDQWREMMFGLAATHHQTGPVRVDDDGTGHTHVSAHHWLEGGEVWVVHGHYTFKLDGDRITELTLLVHQQEGDRTVPEQAQERSKSNPVRG